MGKRKRSTRRNRGTGNPYGNVIAAKIVERRRGEDLSAERRAVASVARLFHTPAPDEDVTDRSARLLADMARLSRR